MFLVNGYWSTSFEGVSSVLLMLTKMHKKTEGGPRGEVECGPLSNVTDANFVEDDERRKPFLKAFAPFIGWVLEDHQVSARPETLHQTSRPIMSCRSCSSGSSPPSAAVGTCRSYSTSSKPASPMLGSYSRDRMSGSPFGELVWTLLAAGSSR